MSWEETRKRIRAAKSVSRKSTDSASLNDNKYSYTKDYLQNKGFTFGVNADYINSFSTDAQTFFGNEVNRYNSSGYDDTKSAYDEFETSAKELEKRKATIRSYLSAQRRNLTDDQIKEINSVLTNYDKNYNAQNTAYKAKLEAIASYKDKETYNTALNLAKRTASFAEKYGITSESSSEERSSLLNDLKVKRAKEGLIEGENKELDDEIDFLENYGIYVGFSTSEEYNREIDRLQNELETIQDRVKNKAESRSLWGELRALSTALFDDYSNSEGADIEKQLESLTAQRDMLKAQEEFDAKYQPYRDAEDFAEGSKYVSTAKNLSDEEIRAQGYEKNTVGEWGKIYGFGSYEAYEPYEDMIYEYINADEKTQEDMEITEIAERGIVGSNREDNVKSSRYRTYSEMTDEEVALYNYLYNKEKALAEEYLKELQPTLDKRFESEEYQRLSDLGKGSPIAASLISIGSNSESSLMAPLQILDAATADTGLFDSSARATSALRTGAGEWASGLDVDIPLVEANLGEFLYGSVMSLADMGVASVTGSLLGGGGKAASRITQAIMSSSAASSAVYSAHERGITGPEVAVYGIAAGATEWVTEKFSIENLFSGKSKGILLEALKQMGIEATEEGAATLLNTAVDEFVSSVAGHESELEAQVTELMKTGVTREEAEKQVLREFWQGVGTDMLAGALTGAFMGGGKGAVVKSTAKAEQQAQAFADELKKAQADGAVLGVIGMSSDGTKVSIGEGGKYSVTAVGEDGEAVSADISSLPDGSIKDILLMAEEAGMTPAAAQALLDGYDGKTNVNEYLTEAEYVYAMGKSGTPKAEVSRGGGALTEAVRDVMYEDGLSEMKRVDTERQNILSTIKKNATGAITAGVYDDSAIKGVRLTKAQNRALKVAEAVSKLGFNIKVVDGIRDNRGRIDKNKLGYYDSQSQTIVVSANAKINRMSQIIPTLAHEITHQMRDTSPELYDEYRSIVLEAFSESRDLNGMIDEEMSRLLETGRYDVNTPAEKLYDAAVEELVSRASEDMLMSEETIKRVFKENRTLGEKVLEIISDFVEKLKGALSGLDEKSEHAEAKFFREMLDYFEKAQTKWAEAFEDSSAVLSAARETGETIKGTKDGAVYNEGDVESNLPQHNEKSVFSKSFVSKILNDFGIKKIGDYIHVQKQVFNTLLREGFFTDDVLRSRSDINEASGMTIETNKSSISETFNLSNYGRLGKFKKIAKLATVRSLPEIIRNGELISDNVPNQYRNSENKSYAYIIYEMTIDGVPIAVKLDIKKSPVKNKLWVHSIVTEKNSTSLDVSSETGTGTSYRADANDDIISQYSGSVNTSNEIVFNEDTGEASMREVLSGALMEVAQSEEERTLLREYQEKSAALYEKEAELDALNEEIRRARYTRADYSEEVEAMMDRSEELDEQIRELKRDFPATLRRQIKSVKYQISELTEQGDSSGAANLQRELEELKERYSKALEFETTEEFEKIRSAVRELQEERSELEQQISEKATAPRAERRQNLETLQKKRQRLLREVNKADRVLLSLEVSKPLSELAKRERMRIRKAQKEKTKAILKEYRTARETKRVRDSVIKKSKELITRFVSNTDNKNIKEGFKKTVLKFMDIMTREEGVYVGNELLRMQEQYRRVARSLDSSKAVPLLGDTVEYLNENLDDLAEILRGKSLGELSVEEINDVNTIITTLRYMIAEEDKIFINGRKRKITDIGEETAKAVDSLNQKNYFGNGKIRRFIETGLYAPQYFFKRLGSWFQKFFDEDLVQGAQNKVGRYYHIANTYINGLIGKNGKFANVYTKKWLKDKPTEFTTERGETFKLTTLQTMYVYAANKRENEYNEGTNHLLGQGIVPEDIAHKVLKGKKYKEALEAKEEELRKSFSGSEEELENALYELRDSFMMSQAKKHAVKLTESDVDRIVSSLNEVERAFADELVRFLTEEAAEWGNETTMLQYGIRKFTSPYYIPFVVDTNYVQMDTTDVNFQKKHGTRKLQDLGFTKKTGANATAPLIACDILDVFADHVSLMANYSAYVPAIDTLNKLMNYRDRNGNQIKNRIRSSYGENAVDYINKYVEYLNGGSHMRTDKSPLAWFISTKRRNRVLANIAVVIQQPISFIRAGLKLGARDMIFFLRKRHKGGDMKTYEKRLKYAPGVTVMKEMGHFDMAGGKSAASYIVKPHFDKIYNSKKLLYNLNLGVDKVSDFTGVLAEYADRKTWDCIWNACESDVARKNPELTGEAFYEAVGRRFTEVITYTQVYNSPLTKPEMMRSNNELNKAATSYMGEPLLWLNAFYDTFLNRNSDKTQLKNVLACFITSVLINNLIRSLAYAARDEDEEEAFLETYLSEVATGIAGDFWPLSYIPYLRDITSVLQDYNVSRGDMDLFEDLINSVKGLTDDETSNREKAFEVITYALEFAIPAENIAREFRALFINPWRKSKNHTLQGVTYAVREAFGKSNTDYDGYVDALASGDTKESEEIYAAIVEYKLFKAERKAEAKNERYDETEARKAAESAIQGKITEAMKDTYKSYIDSLDKSDYTTAKKAADEITKINIAFAKDKAKYAGKEFTDKREDKARESINSSLRSKVTKHFKPLYLTGDEAERERISKILRRTGLYENVRITTKGWIEKAEEEED